MRVLHFFKTYWPDTFGGVERTIHAIAKGTQKFGIDSDVLSLSRAPAENSRVLDGHFAHKSKLNFELASTGFSADVFSRFSELSRTADIIHYHFPWPLMDIVHLASPHDRPTVVTYHSDIVKQRALLQLYRPLMNRFLASVDRIVATSPNYLSSSPVLQKFNTKTTVIPLGLAESDYPAVDPEAKAQWAARLPKRFFVFVGVLRYYKGVKFLLEAAKASGLETVLIGDGPMRAELEAWSRQHNLGNVHFLGALPDADKLAILDLSIGLVFPSHLRSEAFGLSLVEAAMRGKPMISCELGTGTSYVNVDGETGFVVEPADAGAIAEAMKRLHDDAGLAQSMGNAARRRYATLLTAERMSESYRDLYQDLLLRP